MRLTDFLVENIWKLWMSSLPSVVFLDVAGTWINWMAPLVHVKEISHTALKWCFKPFWSSFSTPFWSVSDRAGLLFPQRSCSCCRQKLFIFPAPPWDFLLLCSSAWTHPITAALQWQFTSSWVLLQPCAHGSVTLSNYFTSSQARPLFVTMFSCVLNAICSPFVLCDLKKRKGRAASPAKRGRKDGEQGLYARV